MTRKSRLFVLITAASLPLIAACNEATTAPELKSRMDGGDSASFSCRENLPWGFACPTE